LKEIVYLTLFNVQLSQPAVCC